MTRSLHTLVAATALFFSAGSTYAQTQTAEEPAGFPVERLRPSLDRNGILDVESADVGNHLDYDVALWGSYAWNPLTLSRRNPDGTVERAGVIVGHRLGAFLVGGVSLFDVAQIGAELPVVLLQLRGDPPATADAALQELNAVGVGDLRIVPKLSITRWIERFTGIPRYLDVSLIPAFTVPTGFPQGAYMGEGFFTFAPELAVSSRIKGFKLGGNLALRFRPETKFLGLNVSHELTYRFGFGYDLRDELKQPFDFGVSLTGATALLTPFSEINQNPLELLAGGSWDVWGPVQVFGGVGVGLIAGFGTPDLRVLGGVRYSPRARDRDGDGIDDDKDACPDEPEDKDGFEDSDGCPDRDNDQDGVLDEEDRCPLKPGVPERQGCPSNDGDGDGITDDVDGCPDEPEDVDDFEDLDGCPELDNDGDGIQDADDKCPLDPEDVDGFQDQDGCPDGDNDEDGLADDEDKCPDEAEDFDGFTDQDGCPDTDNDEDGLLDADDECPDKPEDFDGDADEDGCPDDARVVVTRSQVQILETVYFETNSAKIKPQSYSLLNDVSEVIKTAPGIGRIRIEGHTDATGPDGYNLLLSQRRADSVRRYLIKRGVDGSKLEAKGLGETEPIATNDTEEGRAKNRRVVFRILGEDE